MTRYALALTASWVFFGATLVGFVSVAGDWAHTNKELGREVAIKQRHLDEYTSIAYSPELLRELLDRYEVIHDQLVILEMGVAIYTKPNVVVQCFPINVPEHPRLWMAGL